MPSTLQIDTIKDASASNTLFEQSGSDWAWGSAPPAGTILQVVSVTNSDAESSTSNSFVDITGFSVAISPSSSSNYFFLNAMVNGGQATSTASYFLRLYISGGGTDGAILINSNPSSRTASTAGGETPGSTTGVTYNHGLSGRIRLSDSIPDWSSGPLTAKVQWSSSGSNTIRLNRTGDNSDSSGKGAASSTLTIFEIKG